MTITAQQNRVVHTANGTTTFFSTAPIEQMTAATTVVTLVTSAGVETVVNPADYTVSPSGVTFNSPPANGLQVVIERRVPLTQPDNYVTNAPFPAEVTEARLDEIVKALQQLDDTVSRCLRVSGADPGGLEPIARASARANKFLAFNSAGAPVLTSGPSLSGIVVSAFSQPLLALTTDAAWRAALNIESLSTVGLGATFPPLPPSNDCNQAVNNGLYRTNTSTANRPANNVAFLHVRIASNQDWQIAGTTSAASPTRTLWFRSRYADASWSPWTEMASKEYVDGAVGSITVPGFILMNMGVV